MQKKILKHKKKNRTINNYKNKGFIVTYIHKIL